MAKKLVKKKKLKVWNLFLVLLVLVLFALIVWLFLKTKTKNIIIIGTTNLNDDTIIELAKVKDYPSFYTLKSHQIKKQLEKNPYIKRASVKKKFYHVLEIKIDENKPIFMNEVNHKIVLEDKTEVEIGDLEEFRVPRLMNYVPDTKYASLIKHISQIDRNILGKVSEITYTPNDFDKDRFRLYMDDDNTVYLTLTKFKMLNYYNKVVTQLEGRKGILYLDSGNHFQIKE